MEWEALDSELLVKAIRATFERRGMAVPVALPIGLSDEFAHDRTRQSLWLAFIRKNELAPEPLPNVVARIRVLADAGSQMIGDVNALTVSVRSLPS